MTINQRKERIAHYTDQALNAKTEMTHSTLQEKLVMTDYFKKLQQKLKVS